MVIPPGWTVRVDPGTHALVLDHVAVERGDDEHARRLDRAPAGRERARDRRRRDGDDDLPHRALGGRPRRDGLLGRALRADRRDRRSGGDDPAAARLDPERDEDAVRALRRPLPARRRLHRQRPVRRREPPAGRVRRQAVLRGRDAARLRRHDRPSRRHRRPGAGLVRQRQHRGVPGGPAAAVGQALRRRRAGRGPLRRDPGQRAHPARADRRPQRPGRRLPHRRPEPPGARRSATAPRGSPR